MLIRFLLLLTVSSFSLQAFARLKVATTFTVIRDIAQHVAGSNAQVVSITKLGADVHSYEPTPQDVIKTQEADLIIWNGLDLELWFERFFSNLNSIPSVIVSRGVEPISIYDGLRRDKPNPHAWMSPTNALIYIENIRKALVKYDPQNAIYYNRNASVYSQRVRALRNRIVDELNQLPEKERWLATSEGAFSYLARDFNLNEIFLWRINAERQGTPKQIKSIVDKMRTHHIRAIFSESTVSDKPAKQVARETGAEYGGILYVDSLSRASGPVPTYLDLMQVTTRTIAKGLLKNGKR